MGRRRCIAWVLVWVSMVMLAAAVLPHHHHREILCLQHDVETPDCKHADSHRHAASDEENDCHTGCVTKFKSIAPDRWEDGISPAYSFCSLLYTLADVLSLSVRLSESNAKPSWHYAEKLHAIRSPHPAGLRAPPCVLA